MARTTLRFVVIVACLVTLFGAQSPPEQDDFWQPKNGTGGAKLTGSLITDANGNVFASMSHGLARSTDHGETWTVIDDKVAAQYSMGLGVGVLGVNAGGDVFAGSILGGLFRFVEKGQVWEATELGFVEKVVSSVGFGADGEIFVGTHRSGLFHSADNGATWTAAATFGEEVPPTSIAVSAGGDVFVGSSEGRVFRSTDGGESWTVSETVSGSAIYALVIADDGDIFAGAPFGGVMRSADNGDSWEWHPPWDNPMTRPAFASLAVDADGRVFAGTGDGPGVMRSTDDGRSWRAFENMLTGSLVRPIAASPKGPLFAGTPGGIFRSDDNGESWKAVNPGLIGSDIWSAAANRNGQVFVGTFARGIFRSADNGETWEEVNVGLTDLHIGSLVASPSGSLFAGAPGAGLFRSRDSGEHWEALSGSASAAGGSSQALTISEQGDIFVGGYMGVFRSRDDGDSWEQVYGDAERRPSPIESIAIKSNGHIFAGGQRGLFRSTDNGDSFTDVAVDDFEYSMPNYLRYKVKALAIGASGSVFAGVEGPPGLYRSTDNGSSWESVGSGLPEPKMVRALVADASGTLYVVLYGSGVFRSTDNGDTWHALNAGLTNKSVQCLAITPDEYLIAGTSGGGVFWSVRPVTRQ